MSTLDGSVAVVTGATGALGAAVCEAFAAAGATVVGTTHGEEHGPGPGGALIVAVDLTDEAAVNAFAARVQREHGRVDAVLACAGGYGEGRAADTSLAEWQKQLDRNTTSAFLTARAFLPGMVAAGRGSIVLVGSRAAERPFPGAAAYIVSKAAVASLTQVLALESREAGVRVNAVLPSIIDTPANRAASPDADTSRWVSRESLAGTMLWLCSDAARDVSGVLLKVEGRS
jgi:NAD(P)-dependent dehydrogenase (short-subunit alcohol dehydrogenase family)